MGKFRIGDRVRHYDVGWGTVVDDSPCKRMPGHECYDIKYDGIPGAPRRAYVSELAPCEAPDSELWYTPETPESLRTKLLQEAEKIVTGDRNNAYGPPHQDFARTAGALASLGYGAPNDRTLEAHDVAIILAVVKLSRLTWSPGKRDSWMDLAGYAACGHEAYELTKDESE